MLLLAFTETITLEILIGDVDLVPQRGGASSSQRKVLELEEDERDVLDYKSCNYV
jgi:hypothetical protein